MQSAPVCPSRKSTRSHSLASPCFLFEWLQFLTTISHLPKCYKMARGARKRRAATSDTTIRSGDPWSPAWELLAYLDSCLFMKPDIKRFRATVSGHLRESVQVSWTLREIDRRIIRLWNQYRALAYENCDCENLLYHGTHTLDFGNDDDAIKHRIQQRAKQIRYSLTRVRRDDQPRATRSKGVSHHIGLDDEFEEHGRRAIRNRESITVEVPVRRPRSIWLDDESDTKVWQPFGVFAWANTYAVSLTCRRYPVRGGFARRVAKLTTCTR